MSCLIDKTTKEGLTKTSEFLLNLTRLRLKMEQEPDNNRKGVISGEIIQLTLKFAYEMRNEWNDSLGLSADLMP